MEEDSQSDIKEVTALLREKKIMVVVTTTGQPDGSVYRRCKIGACARLAMNQPLRPSCCRGFA
jgi:hypothetical protein